MLDDELIFKQPKPIHQYNNRERKSKRDKNEYITLNLQTHEYYFVQLNIFFYYYYYNYVNITNKINNFKISSSSQNHG